MRHLTFNLTTGIFFAWAVLRADQGRPGLLAWISAFSFVRLIGKISYGIYLTHAFFPQIFTSEMVIDRIGTAPLWAQGTVCLVLSVAVPALSWHLMESPLLRLKTRILDGGDSMRTDAGKDGPAPVARSV